MTDALSRKSQTLSLAALTVNEQLIEKARRMDLELLMNKVIVTLAAFMIQPSLIDKIQAAQILDEGLQKIVNDIKEGRQKDLDFKLTEDGVLKFKDRLCVPKDEEMREMILKEAHSSPYSIHLGSTKMYKDLKKLYWWSGMKTDVASHVANCLNCQQIKAETQRPHNLLVFKKIMITKKAPPEKIVEVIRVPPFDYFKLNIDECSLGNLDYTGAGGVIRDDSGFPMRCFASYEGVGTNFMVEFNAIFFGLHIASLMNAGNLLIECDLQAVNCIIN
ncbi:uncharacterized protein LOC122084173 [Macadamia integrifolia]|uniref:uncharacterized protein LOC122084173 n=1 Tax=Macadamia integrifolia TaxID=60698 RepID=UPI001C4E9840|nr:uncharacterized protein LOC122084173 [Macadamia integrifolia]